ncbi:MAG TPA: dTDP-4-dehydrorhamnose 3,5-epimerase family protein [Capsulimonadaceae bacterium]|jgi:dTDP-4-dehydrorhamnose 3,5-epimerase
MLKKLSPTDLAPAFQEVVSTQSYEKVPTIEGVKIIDLRLMVDDGGSFAELIRLDENGNLELIPEFKVRQSSYSEVLPGAIKAFHLHYNQDDVWFVPPTDRMLIGLIDARADSPTCGVSMRFVLGGGRARLVFIPRGVGHGGANIWDKSSTIFYFVNQKFDLADADERRLPYNVVGEDFWKITPG